MNKKQRLVILIGIIILLLMGLFPPFYWTQEIPIILGSQIMSNSYSTYHYNQYGFLFYPPTSSARVDLERLLVQLLVVVFVTGGIVFYIGGPKESKG